MSNREAVAEMVSSYSNARGLKIYQLAFAPTESKNRNTMYYSVNVAAETVQEAIDKAWKRIAPKWEVTLLYVELLATETFPLKFD